MVHDLMRSRLQDLTTEMEQSIATRSDIDITELHHATSDSQVTELAKRIWNDGNISISFRLAIHAYVSDFSVAQQPGGDAVESNESLMAIAAIYEAIIAYLSR